MRDKSWHGHRDASPFHSVSPVSLIGKRCLHVLPSSLDDRQTQVK